MALTNYTTISAAVTDWLNRTGSTPVTDNMEDFFKLAQDRMFLELPINSIEAVSTLAVDAESETVPTGLTDVIAMWLVGTTTARSGRITRTTLDQVLKYTTSEAGSPKYFAQVNNEFFFGPVPTESVNVRIHYHLKPTVVSTSNATNHYTDNAPGLLLAAVMVEAYLFLKDDERAKLWEGKYQQNMKLIEAESWRQDAMGRRVRDVNHESSNWSP